MISTNLRMKILMVNDTIPFIGGAETYLHNLSKALDEKGHEIITLSEKPDKEENFTYIKKQYFAKTYPDKKINYAVSRYWNVYAKEKIRKIIKEENPDIIHFHNVFARLSPSVILEATKYKPTVLTVHDTRFDWHRFMYLDKNFDIYPGTFGVKCLFNGEVNPFMFLYQYTRNFLYRKALNKIDAIITLNNFVKNKLNMLIKNRDVFIQPLFIPEMPNILDIKKENFILFAGRIEEYKGLKYLIHAMKIVNEKFDASLIIAGEGKEKKELEELTKKINIKAKFIGKVKHDDMLKLYQKASIVCVPSLADNSPMTIYEAMSCGTPVIASNVCGIPDLINDGIDGFLAKPKNSEEIAEKIMVLLGDEKLRKKIGENARNKTEKEFSKEKHINKILEIYNFAIEKFKKKKLKWKVQM